MIEELGTWPPDATVAFKFFLTAWAVQFVEDPIMYWYTLNFNPGPNQENLVLVRPILCGISLFVFSMMDILKEVDRLGGWSGRAHGEDFPVKELSLVYPNIY